MASQPKLGIYSSVAKIDVDPSKPIDMNELMKRLMDEPLPTEPVEQMKRCVRCRRTKQARHYLNDANNGHYRNSTCTACLSDRQKSARNNVELYASGGRKRCSRCKQIKHVGEFHRHRGTVDGLQTECKVCKRERGRAT